jgi:hypothetical protein
LKNLTGRDHVRYLNAPYVDDRGDCKEIKREVVDWMRLAWCLDTVNMVMYLEFHKRPGIYGADETINASR